MVRIIGAVVAMVDACVNAAGVCARNVELFEMEGCDETRLTLQKPLTTDEARVGTA